MPPRALTTQEIAKLGNKIKAEVRYDELHGRPKTTFSGTDCDIIRATVEAISNQDENWMITRIRDKDFYFRVESVDGTLYYKNTRAHTPCGRIPLNRLPELKEY